MTDEVFRAVVTAGVALAAIAFLIQAIVAIALYRAFRTVQEKAEMLVDRASPVIEKAGPVLDTVRSIGEQAVPVVEKAGKLVEKAGPAIEKIGPAFDRAIPVLEKAGSVLESAGKAVDSTQRVIDETRPRISQISADIAGITSTGREQVQRVGEFVTDATARARARVEQVDASIEKTVENVGNAGTAVKQKVLKPVRGAGGLAAGVFAALSVLARGRRYSPDSATQDEEMFI